MTYRYHVACTWRDKDTYYNAAGYFLFATRIKSMSQNAGACSEEPGRLCATNYHTQPEHDSLTPVNVICRRREEKVVAINAK